MSEQLAETCPTHLKFSSCLSDASIGPILDTLNGQL